MSSSVCPGHTRAHPLVFMYLSTGSESLWKSFHQQNKILWPSHTQHWLAHISFQTPDVEKHAGNFFFFLRQDMNKERYTISWGPTFQTLLSAAGKAWVCAGEGCSNSSWKRESEEVDSLLLKKLIFEGFPDGSVVKNLPANAGDMGSIPDTGRSHTEQLSPRSSTAEPVLRSL